MASSRDEVVEIIQKYVRELTRHNINIEEAILFGSFAQGNVVEESDIDVALISDVFSDDRFDERRKIIPFRRSIDSRLEPIPFSRRRFNEGGTLIDDIKRTGFRIAI